MGKNRSGSSCRQAARSRQLLENDVTRGRCRPRLGGAGIWHHQEEPTSWIVRTVVAGRVGKRRLRTQPCSNQHPPPASCPRRPVSVPQLGRSRNPASGGCWVCGPRVVGRSWWWGSTAVRGVVWNRQGGVGGPGRPRCFVRAERSRPWVPAGPRQPAEPLRLWFD